LSGLQALQGIEHVESQGGTSIRVGALTRHNDVAANGLVLNQLPVLAQVVSSIGDNQVRNRGTVGGSIANSDPAADLPAALLGLQAVINTQDRQIPADDFFSRSL
jgi:carbon-monoxide dehydrogenase medium subunit